MELDGLPSTVIIFMPRPAVTLTFDLLIPKCNQHMDPRTCVRPKLGKTLFIGFARAMRSSRYCHNVRPSVCPSVCLSGTGVHCDHTVHFIPDLSSQLDRSNVLGTLTPKHIHARPSRLFTVPPGTEVGYVHCDAD